MTNIIILGPQGSGKGAQAEILVKKFNLAYFSMGDQLRKISEEDSPLGRNIKEKIEKGELVDDETIFEIFSAWLNKNKDKNFIFDGIPRNLNQAERLDQILKNNKIQIKVLFLDISKETALKRLATRKVCQSCKAVYGPFSRGYKENICHKCNGNLIRRSDETSLAIEKRLEEYYNKTKPVIDYYQKQKNLIEIDGEPSVDEVTKLILEKLL